MKMKKLFSKVLSFAMITTLVLSLVACGGSNQTAETAESKETAQATETVDADMDEGHKIGVVVYDVNDAEVQMFRGYFESYIAESFPVKFVYSASVSTWEEEEQFLNAAIEEGVQGFISFNPTNLEEALKICEAAEVYYMMGSGNYDDKILDAVKTNKWYLGCIGPDDDVDIQAGADMVASYLSNAEAGARIMVATGGASMGNYMHEMRARGILDKLAELKGFNYAMSVDEMVAASEICEVETGVAGATVVICPGYNTGEMIEQALGQYDVDAVMTVLASDDAVNLVTDAEATYEHDIWVGKIDCFSQWNRDAFAKTDSFGQPSLNYVAGKYASIVGPAFAAMFQAVCADPEMLRVNGEAFHINHGFWTADSAERYEELYSYTDSYVNNAYSSQDLMNVITSYNPDATFEDFKALTEASDVESAIARMENQ